MNDMDAYRALYVAESRENHETIVRNLLVLEKGEDRSAIDEIFRSAHSLKGMSASMGFAPMEHLCHAMEDVFQQIRNGNLSVEQDLIDNLLVASDDIEAILDDIEQGGDGKADNLEEHVHDLLCLVSGTGGGDRSPAEGPGQPVTASPAGIPPAEETAKAGTAGDWSAPLFTIRISLSATCDNRNLRSMVLLGNLEAIGTLVSVSPPRETVEDDPSFNGLMDLSFASEAGQEAIRAVLTCSEVGEFSIHEAGAAPPAPVSAPPPSQSQVPDQKVTRGSPDTRPERSDKGREVKNLRVDIARLDQMMNLIEDLVINRGRITQIAKKHGIKEMDETLSMIGRSVSDLQNLMMNIRMIPLSVIFNRFPRTVRDIANREGKEVDFVIEGGETELDRSVMDGLNDPLLHIVRNAIDHGIEPPDVREQAGKPRMGHLRICARRDRDNVIILVEDDGKGIDAAKVLRKAVERGLITEESASGLSNNEVYDFLFQAGFSTADKITDISGRGVGLDVVRNSINALKGSIRVESEPGKGSKFELVLPPTMAIVNVMMVRINNRRCAIPVGNVVEVASLSAQRIHLIGSHETIVLRDEVLLLDRLKDMFGEPTTGQEILVVLQHQAKKRSIAVDLIEGQQEVVIKPLGQIIGVCRGVSGVTIPGDGEVVPVLDVNAIVREN